MAKGRVVKEEEEWIFSVVVLSEWEILLQTTTHIILRAICEFSSSPLLLLYEMYHHWVSEWESNHIFPSNIYISYVLYICNMYSYVAMYSAHKLFINFKLKIIFISLSHSLFPSSCSSLLFFNSRKICLN